MERKKLLAMPSQLLPLEVKLPDCGIVITEKGARNPTSVPVLDCPERAGCSVAFRVLNISDEILSHVSANALLCGAFYFKNALSCCHRPRSPASRVDPATVIVIVFEPFGRCVGTTAAHINEVKLR
jgi:hypothetical protein